MSYKYKKVVMRIINNKKKTDDMHWVLQGCKLKKSKICKKLSLWPVTSGVTQEKIEQRSTISYANWTSYLKLTISNYHQKLKIKLEVSNFEVNVTHFNTLMGPQRNLNQLNVQVGALNDPKISQRNIALHFNITSIRNLKLFKSYHHGVKWK